MVKNVNYIRLDRSSYNLTLILFFIMKILESQTIVLNICEISQAFVAI